MITITLTPEEVNGWYQICDRALRNSGMDALDAVAHFRMKLAQAQQAQQSAPKANGASHDAVNAAH